MALTLSFFSAGERETEVDLRLVPPFIPNERNQGRRIIRILFEDLLSGNALFNKADFIPVRNLLRNVSSVILFSSATAISVKEHICGLKEKTGVTSFLEFLAILDKLARSEYKDIPECQQTQGFSLPKPLHKRIEKVCSYTNLNYSNPIRLRDVARIAGMSEDAFGKFFRKHTGTNYITYLNQVRIEAASKMLRKTDDTVAGIAYSCGFGTLSNFRRIFREMKGMSPGELRDGNEDSSLFS